MRSAPLSTAAPMRGFKGLSLSVHGWQHVRTGRWSEPPEVRREVLSHARLKRFRRVFDDLKL